LMFVVLPPFSPARDRPGLPYPAHAAFMSFPRAVPGQDSFRGSAGKRQPALTRSVRCPDHACLAPGLHSASQKLGRRGVCRTSRVGDAGVRTPGLAGKVGHPDRGSPRNCLCRRPGKWSVMKPPPLTFWPKDACVAPIPGRARRSPRSFGGWTAEGPDGQRQAGPHRAGALGSRRPLSMCAP